MADKQTLRTEMYKKRKLLNDKEADSLSLCAQERLTHERAWKESRTVALYSPIRKETQTVALIENAWSTGKQVLLPHTVPGPEKRILFLPCENFKDLKPGLFGILEPVPPTNALLPSEEIFPDIIVVPGVAYDRQGYRLGNGGGYYDRFFARPETANILRLGFVYGFQLVNEIPERESWDLPMHGYCTENECVWLEKA